MLNVLSNCNSNAQCIEHSREKYWVYHILDFIHFIPHQWFKCSNNWACQPLLLNRPKFPLENLFAIEVGDYEFEVLSGLWNSHIRLQTRAVKAASGGGRHQVHQNKMQFSDTQGSRRSERRVCFGYLEIAMVALDTKFTKLNSKTWPWLAVQFPISIVLSWSVMP